MRVFIETAIEKTSEEDYIKNDGYHTVFVKGQGYQWAKYYNGTESWKPMITQENITDKISYILLCYTNN